MDGVNSAKMKNQQKKQEKMKKVKILAKISLNNQANNQATMRRAVDPKVLNAFWTIAENDKEKRLAGIEWLVDHVSSNDSQITSEESNPKDESVSKEMDYVVKRLLKGLASNRDCARLGYAAALTEILRRMGKSLFNLKDLMQMIEDGLPIVGNDSKKEISASRLGRVMAYLCIVQSDLVLHSTSSELVKFVSSILALRQEKVSTSVLCSTVLQQIINKVDKEVVVEHVLPMLETELSCGWEKCDADTLLLLISARERKIIDKKFLNSHWNCKQIVCEDKMKAIGQIIAKSVTHCPSAHPLCYAVLREAAGKDEIFKAFWSTAIYDGVFSSKDSKIKKLICLQIISEGLRTITKPEQVDIVLSPQLLSYHIRSLSNKTLPLHEESIKLATDIVNFTKSCDSGEIQVAILNSLLHSPGGVQLDSMTKTRTLSSIISALNSDGCRLFADHLMEVISNGEASNHSTTDAQPSSSDAAARRVWAAGCLSSLLTHSALISDQQWQINLLKFFFLKAFFTVRKPVPSLLHCDKVTDTSGVAMELRLACKDSLLRCLNKLCSHKTSGKSKSTTEHLLFVNQLGELLQYCTSLLEHPKRISPLNEMTSEVKDRWNSVLKLIAEIKYEVMEKTGEKKKTGDKKKAREIEKTGENKIEGENMNKQIAFKLLFSFEALQMFIETSRLSAGVSQSEIINTATDDNILELETCYKKSLESKGKQKNKRKSDFDKIEEPHWADVLLDLMMSLMSEESHLVRTIVNIVFTLICPYINEPAVKLITDILKPSPGSENPLSFEDDDDDEEMVEDDNNSSAAEDDNAAKDSTNGDISSCSDDDEQLIVDEGLRIAVKEALGSAASKHINEESDSAEESDLDDEAMFKLDDMLAAAFKGMKKGGKQSKAEREQKQRQLLHYRMRCLDLVEVLVQYGTNSLILLDLMLPLLDLMEQGYVMKKETQISDRATRVFRSLCQNKRIFLDASISKEMCTERLSLLMKKSASVSGSHSILQKDIANGCCILLRLLFGERTSSDADSQCKWKKISEIPQVQEMISAAVKEFCDKRSGGVSHVFLHQLFERLPVLLWPLTQELLSVITSTEVKVFFRTQICTVLTSMINKKVVQEVGMQEWSVFAKAVLSTISKYIAECVSDEELKPKLLEEKLRLFSRVLSLTTDPSMVEKSVLVGFMEKLNRLKSTNKEVKKLTHSIDSTLNQRLKTFVGSAVESNAVKSKKKKVAKKQEISYGEAENGTDDELSKDGSIIQESGSEASDTEITGPAVKKRKR